MKRRTFIRSGIVGSGAALLGTRALAGIGRRAGRAPEPATHAGRHRNVLLIVSDDHGIDQLGCYGNSVIKTPSLDALARKGTLFTNAFAVAPSCSASRGSLLTGLYPHQNGQFGHEHSWHHFSLFD